ncbi:MAG: hypothetical protein HIU82_03570 [Proteobacteria bacterium]|nr:hypothetical protein [Pseudomonadota bacterium]
MTADATKVPVNKKTKRAMAIAVAALMLIGLGVELKSVPPIGVISRASIFFAFLLAIVFALMGAVALGRRNAPCRDLCRGLVNYAWYLWTLLVTITFAVSVIAHGHGAGAFPRHSVNELIAWLASLSPLPLAFILAPLAALAAARVALALVDLWK